MSDVREALYSEDFKDKHRLSPTDFTRQRKLPFHLLVLFLANFIKGSLQDELDQCFQAIFKHDVPVRHITRSAISQARRKLSHRVFITLLDVVVRRLNLHPDLITFRGMRVFAIDGSTFRVPNNPVFAAEFGQTNTPKTNRAMAKFSIIHDVLNRLTYDAILDTYGTSENAMAYQHLEEADLPKGSLLLMDRFYNSGDLLNTILDQGHDFCVRLKSNLKIYKAFSRMGKNDVLMPWKLLKDESGKARTVRVVRYEAGGKVYVLATSLLDRRIASLLDLGDLYHQRWQVEESYKVKKCRIHIEEVRGLTPEIVRQDFHAKIFAECLTSALTLELEPHVRRYSDHRENEYIVCLTQALAKMKNTIVLLLVRPRFDAMLRDLLAIFWASLTPCVPGRRYKRRHPGKNARKIQTNSMGYAKNR